jgi:hypothetical protein
MPLVLTSTQMTNGDVHGPLMPELEAIALPAFAAPIKRTGSSSLGTIRLLLRPAAGRANATS